MTATVEGGVGVEKNNNNNPHVAKSLNRPVNLLFLKTGLKLKCPQILTMCGDFSEKMSRIKEDFKNNSLL
jgi:hypothetical protein